MVAAPPRISESAKDVERPRPLQAGFSAGAGLPVDTTAYASGRMCVRNERDDAPASARMGRGKQSPKLCRRPFMSRRQPGQLSPPQRPP
eukprot:scaffold4195_cov250-Pinguiococcus_pyrenoidosus.AAC.5